MVIVVIHSWFPHDKSAEVGKAFIEVMKKYPADRALYKQAVTACVRATENGIKGLAVDDIKEGKLKESLDLIYRRMLMFGDLVEGLKYEIEVYMSGTEAMPMVGLQMPE